MTQRAPNHLTQLLDLLPPPDQAALTETAVPDITPLTDPGDPQTGALPDALFGQGRNGEHSHTYAILDAGKIINLPEQLELSGLTHMPLLRNEEWRDVSPWLVVLDKDTRFTRFLLTDTGADGAIWDKRATLFLRSVAEPQAVYEHLRRFTLLGDGTGRRMFFRFWDPIVAQVVLPGFGAYPDIANRFFYLRGGATLDIISQVGWTSFARLSVTDAHPEPTRFGQSFELDDRVKRLISEASYRALAWQLGDWLVGAYPDHFSIDQASHLEGALFHIIQTGHSLGFEMKEEFAFLTQMMMTSGGWFVDDACPANVRSELDRPSPERTARLVACYADAQRATPQGRLVRNRAALIADLAARPKEDHVTQELFETLLHRHLAADSQIMDAWLASTKARLRDLGQNDPATEGKARLLALLLGPRFFEDPLKPWATLPLAQAVDAAWTATLGLPTAAAPGV